jgi:hypothetical protein
MKPTMKMPMMTASVVARFDDDPKTSGQLSCFDGGGNPQRSMSHPVHRPPLLHRGPHLEESEDPVAGFRFFSSSSSYT